MLQKQIVAEAGTMSPQEIVKINKDLAELDDMVQAFNERQRLSKVDACVLVCVRAGVCSLCNGPDLSAHPQSCRAWLWSFGRIARVRNL